jgi:hypothetical protein
MLGDMRKVEITKEISNLLIWGAILSGVVIFILLCLSHFYGFKGFNIAISICTVFLCFLAPIGMVIAQRIADQSDKKTPISTQSQDKQVVKESSSTVNGNTAEPIKVTKPPSNPPPRRTEKVAPQQPQPRSVVVAVQGDPSAIDLVRTTIVGRLAGSGYGVVSSNGATRLSVRVEIDPRQDQFGFYISTASVMVEAKASNGSTVFSKEFPGEGAGHSKTEAIKRAVEAASKLAADGIVNSHRF